MRLCIATVAVLIGCAYAQLLSGKMFGAAMSEGLEIMPGKNMSAAGCVDVPGIVSRAWDWSNRSIPYCQCNNDCCGTCPYCSTYRCDCSGFVSMTWQLGRGYTTSTLNQVASYISVNDLQQGDALVCSSSKGGHVVLFDSWIKKGSTYHCWQEPGCSANPNHAYWGTCDATWVWSECGTFKPIRLNNLCPPGPTPPSPPPPPPAVPSPPPQCFTFANNLCGGGASCKCNLGSSCSLNATHIVEERKKLLQPGEPLTCAAMGGSCFNVQTGKCGGGTSCLAQLDAC